MKLITISGLDGSGKSTQVKMLQSYIEEKGKKVFYFHAIEFGIAQKINDFRLKYCLICRYLNKCKAQKNLGKSVTKATPFQIWLRKIFLRIDIWRFRRLYSRLYNSDYDYLLSDRYFSDTIVNINYLRQKNKAPYEVPYPTPDLSIYLQTDPDLIMQRERVPDQGLEYLKQKKEIYDARISPWNLKVIDGNRSKKEIFAEIKSLSSTIS